MPAVARNPPTHQLVIFRFLPELSVYIVLYRRCQLCDPKAHTIYSDYNKDA